MSNLKAYYETAFEANEQGNIYRPFTSFERLSHERRMHLLAQLDLPALEGATVVDYGVGAWGIGCIFPRLKEAKVLHGIDISEGALEKTRLAHARDVSLAGKDIRLSQSSGYKFAIEDNSVDLFFAGEAIEHVDETDAFLEEVYRVLRPGAAAVFTTPNALPFVYRSLGRRWCVGFEHTALMNYQELKCALEKYFTLEVSKGFNQSLHPLLDDSIDEASALAWTNACENDPENATGLIVVVRKKDKRAFSRSEVVVIEGVECEASGPRADMQLTPGYLGRMIEPGSSLIVPVPQNAKACTLLFWSHNWSGIAEVSSPQATTRVDLYHSVGGCLRQCMDLGNLSRLMITSSATRNPSSSASQVILMRAVFRV